MRGSSSASISDGRRALVGGAVTAFVLAACAPALPRATSADEARARARWPQATVADLDEGRALYARKCAGCHPLILPGDRPRDSWPRWMSRMSERAGVTPAQQEQIVRYLWATAEDGGEVR